MHDRFIHALTQNLHEHFVDAGVMAHFNLFDPSRLSMDHLGEEFLDEQQVESLEVKELSSFRPHL